MAHAKRGRIEKPQKNRKSQKLALSNREAVRSASKAVALDKLAWKEVALPDRLEDAEGFFGLEEIDDVEIVRDAETGNVQYLVAATKDSAEASSTPSEESANQKVDSSDEWEGFGDHAEEGAPGAGKDTNLPNQTVIPKKIKAKKRGPQGSSNGDLRAGKNNFQLLHGSDDEGVEVSAWASLGLSPQVLYSLSKMKFSKPTTIQSSAIPSIREGMDVIGKASTGSGKTLAFGIPIVEHFLSVAAKRQELNSTRKDRANPPIALILSPTKELARQLESHLEALGSNMNEPGPRIATLIGGLDSHKQQRLLNAADIIIGTPGRLWDFMSSQPGLVQWLRQIKFLVLDEADRLLSEGHFKELEEITNSLDRDEVDGDPGSVPMEQKNSSAKAQRQILVFSATLERDLQRKLAGKGKPRSDTKQQSMEYLLQKLSFRSTPGFIDANPRSQMASNLREGLLECGSQDKDLYLYALLLQHPHARVLVFANSIDAVKRIVPLLQNLSLPAKALYGRMEQKKRLQSLEKFSGPTADPKSTRLMVATDVAARGLDIPGVQLVVHYDAPRTADAYIHRSGRTARADASGTSIMLCDPDEAVAVRRLVVKVHAKSTAEPGAAAKTGLRTLDIDRRVVSRLKPRVSLAKSIADATLAKGKVKSEDKQFKAWAEELGVDYDSEEFAAQAGGKGKHGGRMQKTRETAKVSKEQIARWRADLKAELAQRVNVGVSEKYLTAGGIDVHALLRGDENPFLGGNMGIYGLD